jgi:hypothetical protein
MARVRVLTAGEIGDADLAAMARASGDEMYGVFGHCDELLPKLAGTAPVLCPDGA